MRTDYEQTLQSEVSRQVMRNRMIHLGIQCLLYMSREEEEIPEEIIRPARIEGHHLKSSIVRARFVDEYCHKVKPGQARVIASYQAERNSPAAHWVRGHWRRQPFGTGRAQSKLIWIRPYQTLGAQEQSPGLTKINS